jgi:hypothetical protein
VVMRMGSLDRRWAAWMVAGTPACVLYPFLPHRGVAAGLFFIAIGPIVTGTAYSVATADATDDGGQLDTGRLLAYVLWAGAEVRTALDTGQFRLVYQPIVDLPHGRIVSLGDAAPERISVNVSAHQLAEPGFTDLVASVLAGQAVQDLGTARTVAVCA